MKLFLRVLIVVVLLLAGLVVVAAGQNEPVQRLFGAPIIKTASDGEAGDLFGFDVAMDGGTAVVGAPGVSIGAELAQGAAYIFTYDGVGWSEEQKLLADDGLADDEFGFSVAVDGETALVGAYFADIDEKLDQGAAYLFERSGGTWNQVKKLTAGDGNSDSWFGYSVALSGDTAVVAAPQTDVNNRVAAGAVYIFTRSGNAWVPRQKLTFGSEGDNFGFSVAVSGETLLVGAAYADVGANVDQGEVYVYRRSGMVWNLDQRLKASDGATEDYFGSAVALDGNTAVIGAGAADVGGNMDQGAAYVFVRGAGGWSEQKKLVASDGAAEDWFGYTVDVNGNTAIVGADWADVNGNLDQGAAYLFSRSGNVWSEDEKLVAYEGGQDDYFGSAAAVFGSMALVGADSANVGPAENQGKVYFFVPQPLKYKIYLPAIFAD